MTEPESVKAAKAKAAALASVTRESGKVKTIEAKLAQARTRRLDVMHEAREAGATLAEIADAAAVSRETVKNWFGT